MSYKKYLSILLLPLFLVAGLLAQTPEEEIMSNPEKSGGTYYAYPVNSRQELRRAPEGYEPFYVSHFGRHGSRYLDSEEDYSNLLALLGAADMAGALTPAGEELLIKMEHIWEEAENRSGDLSPLGVRQLKEIADRMYDNFPSLFSRELQLKAISTLVPRCILSMDAFCEKLKERNPALDITRDASKRYFGYLNYRSDESIAFRRAEGVWKDEYQLFEAASIDPHGWVYTIFCDTLFVTDRINPLEFMKALFKVAAGLQNMETEISLFDFFEKQQLFNLWQNKNYLYYVNDGPSALSNGVIYSNSKPQLKNIIEEAELIINARGYGGSFRFAHDGNLIPLAALMGLEGCDESISTPADFYKAWQNYYVSPMGANIQLIFFRKEVTNDVLVQVLHNEKEVTVGGLSDELFPFYRWSELKCFFEKRIAEL